MLGLVLGGIGEDEDSYRLIGVGVWTIIIGSAAIIVSLGILITAYITAEADKISFENQYDSLIYKIESNIYQDNANLEDINIINEIKSWNELVLTNQYFEKNFWVGIYCPNIYGDLQTIDYENINVDNNINKL